MDPSQQVLKVKIDSRPRKREATLESAVCRATLRLSLRAGFLKKREKWRTPSYFLLRDGFSEGGLRDESTARGMNGSSLEFFLGLRWSILNAARGAGFRSPLLRMGRIDGLGRFYFQPVVPAVEEFTDFVDQLAEAHWVLLFCGKGAEVFPAFWISFRACVGLHL